MALTFRQRIFASLVLIGVVPAAIAVTVSLLSPEYVAPVGGSRAWEEAAASWRLLRGGIRPERLSPGTRLAMERHDTEISGSVRRALMAEQIHSAFSGILAAGALSLAVLVFGGAVSLAGHFSRQLSRPIDELLTWTERIERGDPLPDTPPVRGAPEFTVLRDALKKMAGALDRARIREIEAAELRAFRELARQVAHELKNPLTPIRIAVQRLGKDATPAQKELVEVLDAESRRLEQMARDFGELGRLPEGPTAAVDLGEVCDELARGAPEGVTVRVEGGKPSVPVTGHYEPLRRALQNLVLNAIDAVQDGARAGARGKEIVLGVRSGTNGSGPYVEVTVADNGVGIAPENLARIFEPHFTTKSHGTGLGLAIVRQTIRHHGGTIEARSEAGLGTTMTVRLPAGAA
ncbi:MAG TPA: HAMP domain-containing sensor histidine kinase [Gemmatimonadales bacterium]